MSDKKEINQEELKNVNGGGFFDILKKVAEGTDNSKRDLDRLEQDQLEKVNGGFYKVTEFSFTLTYKNSSGEQKTGTITASGTNRTNAKTLAVEKAKDWCNENNCTYLSLE